MSSISPFLLKSWTLKYSAFTLKWSSNGSAFRRSSRTTFFLKIFTKLNPRRSKDSIVYKAYITSSKIRYIFNGPLIWTMGRFISSLTVRIIYFKNSLFFGELCFSRHNNEETKILSLIQFFFVLTKHKQWTGYSQI